MKRCELQASWKGLREEIIQNIAKWREQHPKATIREIEEENDKSLSELRAKMIWDTAMQNAKANWEPGVVGVV